MTSTGCANKKISPEKCYSYGNLRIEKADNGVELFSFFVRDEFIDVDESKSDKYHSKMTKNEVLLLNEHLKRRGYCQNSDGESSFIITKKQEPVYQEVQNPNMPVDRINIMPMGFFGRCNYSKN